MIVEQSSGVGMKEKGWFLGQWNGGTIRGKSSPFISACACLLDLLRLNDELQEPIVLQAELGGDHCELRRCHGVDSISNCAECAHLLVPLIARPVVSCNPLHNSNIR